MKYELIAVDMDGTLLNSENEVSERTQKALKMADAQGIKVVIATGRVYTSARAYGELLGLSTPIIACNGAIIRDRITNNILYQNTINLADGLKAFEICRKNHFYYHFYDQDRLYVEERWRPLLEEYYFGRREKGDSGIRYVSIEDSGSYIQENSVDLLKIVMIDPDTEKLERAKPLFQEIKNVEIDRSWFNNLEIMNQGVSKGAALKRISEYYNIPAEKMIAFGDNYNDLSMSRYAGAFVAMGNSDEAIQQKATYVTATNDEDGVALGIEKYVLS